MIKKLLRISALKHICQLILIFIISISSLHAQQILLPVEVLGAEGKIVTRTFDLSANEASSAVRLWMQVNNLSYENKASVKINNGAWLTLNHATVMMQAQEKARGGMVHGGFNTIRFSIPASGLVAGSNTISFRFDKSDGISNGFRVVKFNLLDVGLTKLLPENRFKQDDPATWVGPYTDAASIQEGKNLWYSAPLKSNNLPSTREGFWYAAKIKPAETIKATCTSCHTHDGRDLEIFSYSNESIVERAKFHQLTEEEGKKIASYIRSLSTSKPNVGRWGRPWNPPYQPGPAVANMPVQQWAAGAGLDAVLEEDKDMLPYLFPNGVNQEEVYKHFDSDKTLDRTTLPLAIQFPDWKHWLPIIHPMDAYSKNDYWNTPKQYDPKKGYTDFRNYLTAQDPSTRNKTDLMNKSNDFRTHYRFFLAQGSPVGNVGGHWREPNGTATANLADGVSREMAATSLARLLAVQYFEIFNEFNLQDKAHWFTQPNEYPGDLPKTRQWFGNDYHVFEVPAHFQACVNNNCNQFMGQPTETGFYESTNWYHLQLVIGGGEGMMSWNSPVDYNYHPDFMVKASNSSGVYEPLRYYHSMNAMYQTRTWVGGQNPNNGLGFRIRVMGPWHLFGISDGNQFNGFAAGEFAKLLDKVEPGMTAWVLNAMLRQFLKELNKPYNSLAIWNRVPDGDDNALDRADKTYADILDALQRTERQEGFFYHYAAKMYYYIPHYQKLGVDCQIMEEWITWCQRAWPNIDWNVFRNKGQMQLTLLLADNKFCSGTNTIEAIGTNMPTNAVYTWKVNGTTVAGNGNQLSMSNLNPGDVVTCQVTNNLTCLANKTVEARIVVPSKGYNLTMRKVGEANFKPLGNTVACVNDKVEFKLNIDLQPKQWLDAMDVNSGAEPANNSKIASWWDKTGHGFNADANKVELQPKYVNNAMNGLPAIVFGSENNADGLELFTTAEDDFMNNDWTIIFVGHSEKPAGNEDWRDIIGNKTEGSNGWFWRFGSNARVQMGIGNNLQHGIEYSFNRSYIAQITKKGDVITCYLNGRSDRVIARGATAMTITDALYIGQSAGGNQFSNRYHKGPISELLVFESAITDAEKEFLEGYLTNKWKLNNELAYTHPYYKNSPFDISLNVPNGTKVKLDPIANSQTVNIDQTNKFGTYNFVKEVCGATVESMSINDGCNTTQTPYGGTPWPIPGKIELENYDNGGEGVAYHDNEATNFGGAFRTTEGVDVGNCPDGTYNVGFIGGGEWTEYTVNVTNTGAYTLQARVATPNANKSFHVEVDGVNISGVIAVPVTGSWDTYQTVSVTTANITAGPHVVRVVMDTDGFNFNHISFSLNGAPVITSSSTGTGVKGRAFKYAIVATNNPTSYNATGLPAGLTINATTGVISGTTTAVGTYTVTISATNSVATVSALVTITIKNGFDIAPFGDSITQSDSTHNSYRYPLWKKLIDANVAFNYVGSMTTNFGGNPTTQVPYNGINFDTDNEGHWGIGTNDFANNYINYWSNGYSPDLVLLHLGTNDVSSTPTTTSRDNLIRIINRVRERNPYAVIFIAKIIPRGATVHTAYNDMIAALAASMNTTDSPVILVDQSTGFNTATDTYDQTHPNAIGDEKMAVRWFEAIAAYLNIAQPPVVSSAGTASGTVGTAFSYTITASNTPTSYGATGLPAGLTVNTTTGVITGTPTTAGTFTATVSATNAGGTGTKAVTITINGIPQTPYGGTAWAIPGKIEVENYDNGGEGVAYHDNEATNYGGAFRTTEGVDVGNCPDGTYNIGWIGGAEWTEYTVNVATTGTYTMQVRVATPNPGRSFHVELDGVNISGAIAVPNTGSWDIYQTISVTTSSITAGQHILRMYFDTGDFNFNYVNFTPTVQTPVITSTTTANGVTGTGFSYQIAATNSPSSYGATGLPAGLSVNTSTGAITGTPTTAGTYTATVSATNAGGTGSQTVTITITNPVTNTPYLGTAWPIPGMIQAENYDDGGEGVAYHDNDVINSGGQQRTNQGVDVENTGDTEGGQFNVGWTNAGEWMKYTVNVTTAGTYTLQARVASPGTGNSLRVEFDGTIIGTIAIPNTGGWQTYQTVSVTTPALTTGQHVVRIFEVTGGFNLNYINFVPTAQAPVVSSAGTASGVTGTAFTYNITASNNPTSYGATGLPAGLTVNTTTGAITGTPTTAGTYNATVTATNASGTGSKAVTITITQPAPVISSAGTASGVTGSAFTYNITASNNPTSYGATGLPAGLTVNTTTGAITGTPTTAGTYNITVTASNAAGSGSKTLTITITVPGSTPYLGTRWAIPGTIQAENYDDGGEGIAYHDNDVINSGGQQRTTQGVDVENTGDTQGGQYNVGWTIAGEWLNYSVNVATTGTYTLRVRVASPNSGRSLRVEMDGATIATVAIPNTTGWQTYQNVDVQTSSITAGNHMMRIFMITDGFNLNSVSFTSAAAPAITSATTVATNVGEPFSYTITGSNSPTSYGATGLPAGLTVNTSTGVISGTPTATGTTNVTITATNATGTGSATLALTVNAINDPAGVITCYKTPSAVTVNGSLSETGWNVTRPMSKTVFGTVNNTATFGVMWDNTNLYVGVKVLDGNLFSDSPNLWEDDAVEVYIDANYNKLTTYDGFDNQIVKGYNKTGVSAKLNITGLQHAWTTISGGYTVEFAIPWSQLGISAPATGLNIGFDIGYNDDDNGGNREGQAMWNGTIDNWQNTSAFGRLTLNAANSIGFVGKSATTTKVTDALLYPNPVTSNYLNVTVENWEGEADMKIINMEGIPVRTASIELINGSTQIDVSGLTPGIYLIQVKKDDELVNKQFVISN